MYGILFTMNSTINATSAIHHIDGIPTEALAKKIADDWVKKLSKYQAEVHTLVYEMEKPQQTEPPLFTYSMGPAGATINLSQEQFSTKLKQLCYHLDYLKDSLWCRRRTRISVSLCSTSTIKGCTILPRPIWFVYPMVRNLWQQGLHLYR